MDSMKKTFSTLLRTREIFALIQFANEYEKLFDVKFNKESTY